MSAAEYVQVWDAKSNTMAQPIEVVRDSILIEYFAYVMSINHVVDGVIQPPCLIQIETEQVIAESPRQRHVPHVGMNGDATVVLVAFQVYGSPEDEVWLWTPETDWICPCPLNLYQNKSECLIAYK